VEGSCENEPSGVLKSSRAISRVDVELKTNLSEIFVFIIILMMEADEIPETLVFNSTSTRLIARDGFSTYIRRENFKSYITFGFHKMLENS
jgi:hypothetical protein